MTSKKKYLVTAALPYANGSPHLGHLTEYIMADIYTRALKACGHETYFLCASDAHGTPIELNAKNQGISPELLVENSRTDQLTQFSRYDINFDAFGSTHDPDNQELVERAFRDLTDAGHIERREIMGNFCPKDERFLPDRFIRGSCPRCRAEEQYGDVCEKCGATYQPTDLVGASCALCQTTPIQKPSEHLFFRLSDKACVAFLREWIDSGVLQDDVANYVRSWVEGGLKDWCISRDGPYHGFAIPNEPNKFFYVWLDAPIAYLAQAQVIARRQNKKLLELWQDPDVEIEHIIGKDIMYFHTLFWPAVLHAWGLRTPSRVHVHGMLTVNGEKMSKSRGTFIKAQALADCVDPQAVRFYFACKHSAQTSDLDLSFEDFVARVNAELVNKHVNLFSRVTQFVRQKLGGSYARLLFAAEDAQQEARQGPPDFSDLLDLARRAVHVCRKIEAAYRGRDLGLAMRELALLADIGNEAVQARRPWDELKSNPEAARLTCTFAAHICFALTQYLAPVIPRLAQDLATLLGMQAIPPIDSTQLFTWEAKSVGPAARVFERIDAKALDVLVVPEAGAQNLPVASRSAPASAEVSEKDRITIDTFLSSELRIGRVLAAERVPKSKKLLRLQVDLGESRPRQIMAGLAEHCAPEELVDKQVVVVANLKPAKIMGELSEGMILAGEDERTLAIVAPSTSLSPGSRVR